MAPKRRKSGPIPFSLMHIGNREKEQIDSAFDAIRANGTENDCTEAVFVRQQLALHASYVDACSKLEAFADEIRVKGAHLVPTRFPMRLTQRTRTSVGDGMYRSFLRCIQDLQCSVAGQHNGAVGDAVTNTDGFLVKLANVLTLESCRVLDGLVSHSEAREVCMSYIQKCRADVVREESAHLLTLAPACEVVLGELNRFGKRATNIYQCVPTRMRAFLKTAERKRLSTAAARLAREPQLQTILAKHSWIFGGDFDDAKLVRIYELLLLTHIELAQALTWQCRRVAYLAAVNPENRCWCGITVGTGVDGALIHAPAHMRRFDCEKRVRLVRETGEAFFTCFLSAVGVANVVLELLDTRRLPLHRIDAAYAERILTFDFCKYEGAARNILEDTVRPWCERVRSALLH